MHALHHFRQLRDDASQVDVRCSLRVLGPLQDIEHVLVPSAQEVATLVEVLPHVPPGRAAAFLATPVDEPDIVEHLASGLLAMMYQE